ncbi:MAG TPA: hypothetical protein VF475_06665 [Sphingobium sp.]
MALPEFKPEELDDSRSTTAGDGHYFDTAHGDVAALHAKIEQGFGDYSFDRAPESFVGSRLENSIHGLSRAAGVFGFVGALAVIAYLVI